MHHRCAEHGPRCCGTRYGQPCFGMDNNAGEVRPRLVAPHSPRPRQPMRMEHTDVNRLAREIRHRRAPQDRCRGMAEEFPRGHSLRVLERGADDACPLALGFGCIGGDHKRQPRAHSIERAPEVAPPQASFADPRGTRVTEGEGERQIVGQRRARHPVTLSWRARHGPRRSRYRGLTRTWTPCGGSSMALRCRTSTLAHAPRVDVRQRSEEGRSRGLGAGQVPREARRSSSSAAMQESMTGPSAPSITWSRL